MRLTLPLAVILILLPLPSSAQRVIGTITDPQTGAPVAGAFIRLLDGDRLVIGVLSDSAGRFTVVAPAAGRYTIRAERIGHATVEDGPFDLAADGVRTVQLASPSSAITLAGIEATGGKRCLVRPDRAAAASRVWAEARKALEITLWARDNATIDFNSTHYIRNLDPMMARVTQQNARRIIGSGHRAFRTPDSDFLVENGFAAFVGDSIEFYGPDAEILLSDAFLDHHCFELVPSPDDDELVGLRFRPLDTRTLPEIRGTLWLERSTALLRWIDYEFIQVDHLLPLGSVPRPLPGEPQHAPPSVRGRNDFRQLPSGVWIVDRWWIRTPLLQQTAGGIRLGGWREEGGLVLDAREAVSAGFRIGESSRLVPRNGPLHAGPGGTP